MSSAMRIAHYLTATHDIDNGSRFFSGSFRVDPWSTAQLLLRMRDELVAAGWDGLPVADTGRSAVLSSIDERLPPMRGTSDRLRIILDLLKRPKINPISLDKTGDTP